MLDHGDVVLVFHDAVNKAYDRPGTRTGDRRSAAADTCWNEIRRLGGRWKVTEVDLKPSVTSAADQEVP
jgi:hypothetical protein